MTESASIQYDAKNQRLICQGDWRLVNIPKIEAELQKISWPKSGTIVVDGKGITQLDSAGAWLLLVGLKKHAHKATIKLENFSEAHEKLFSLVEGKIPDLKEVPLPQRPRWLARFGKQVINQLLTVRNYLSFIGEVTIDALELVSKPSQIRFKAFASIVETSGFQALFIIALLALMIGVVITYQMGLQLKNYGANIFIVDLLGLAILREFAPLITAIMVAGRTGSAFTAQIGTMKINQEVDALSTMGVKPSYLLIIPRIMGLVIALPLLTMWANIFGIFGGMVMSNNMLDISWYNFLTRFQHVVSLKSFLIGLGKAPVFALIIAVIGCYEGMKVQGSADSVGKQTTRSVVLSIFCIIVVDAIFSIILSKLKL